MTIAVLSTDAAYKELTTLPVELQWIRVQDLPALFAQKEAALLINLMPDAADQNYDSTSLPVFINSVVSTLKERSHPTHVVRMNGWNGFIQRSTWELSGEISKAHIIALEAMQKKYVMVADEPGFISARILAMIINEACFAQSEKVSTEAEIDIAMKLGTNYPKGPFEWMEEIGTNNIYTLLQQLSEQDEKYTPASSLTLLANQA